MNRDIDTTEQLKLPNVLSVAYSFGSIAYNLYHYKKEYIDIDIDIK